MKKGFKRVSLKPSLGELMDDSITLVTALYDSHVHWLMTGEKKSYFDVQKYKSLSEIPMNSFESKNFRGDWIFGFGWDDSQVSKPTPYTELDRLNSTAPICFIKKDAHSCLLNSAALKLFLPSIENVPALQPFIERDANAQPTGVLKESAFYALYSFLPSLSHKEIRRCLLTAQDHFLEKGFTHIRDMTCSPAQWRVLREMEKQGELKIFADINFNAENKSDAVDKLIPFMLSETNEKLSHLKIKGLKIFLDGSLGSNTAWLMENYIGSSGNGYSLWSNEDIQDMMKCCWQNNLEFSVHTLGDKAVDNIVDIARQLYAEKIRGYLNLEHVQLVAPETIVKMKSLFVRCHMQPSHWLSDKKFLKDKLNIKTMKNLFAWEALRKAKVPISFGSDSPIEDADVELTYQALKDAKDTGIEAFKGSFFEFYSYPQPSNEWARAKTHFKNYKPVRVELPQGHTEN